MWGRNTEISSSRLSGSGSPDLLEKSDFWSNFLRLFQTNRDESGKVEEIEKCQDILTYPNLSWLFATYPTFPTTNLGNYSQKSRQYRLSRYSKRWEKLEVGKSWDNLDFTQFPNFSRLVSICLCWNTDCLHPTRRPSWPHPNLSQSRDRPSRSRSWPDPILVKILPPSRYLAHSCWEVEENKCRLHHH